VRHSLPSPLERVNTAATTRIHAELDYRAALQHARDEGHTFEEIAEAAGVTRSAIYQILNPKERTK
jgi:transcriptional regulator with XRE-family HTH domain